MEKSKYLWRTKVRKYLPWILINLGIAKKGKNCGENKHDWYNINNKSSGCYHCEVVKNGKLYEPSRPSQTSA